MEGWRERVAALSFILLVALSLASFFSSDPQELSPSSPQFPSPSHPQPFIISAPQLLSSLSSALGLSSGASTGELRPVELSEDGGFGLQLSGGGDDEDDGHYRDVEYLGWSDRKLESVVRRLEERIRMLNHTLNQSIPSFDNLLASRIRALREDFEAKGPETAEEARKMQSLSRNARTDDHQALETEPEELTFLKQRITDFLLRQQSIDYDQDRRILALNRVDSLFKTNLTAPMAKVDGKLYSLEKQEKGYVFAIDRDMTTFQNWIKASLNARNFTKELQSVIDHLNRTYHGHHDFSKLLKQYARSGLSNSTQELENATTQASQDFDLVNRTLDLFDGNATSMDTFIKILKAQRQMLRDKLNEFDAVEGMTQSITALSKDTERLGGQTFKYGHRLSMRIDPCHRQRLVVRHFDLILELLGERRVNAEEQIADQEAEVKKLKALVLDSDAKRRYEQWVVRNEEEKLGYARRRQGMWQKTLKMMVHTKRGGARIERELELIEVQGGMIHKVLKLLGAAKMSEARSESKKLLDFVTETNQESDSSRELQTLSSGLVITGAAEAKLFKKILTGMLFNLSENKKLLLKEIEAKEKDLTTKEEKVKEWGQRSDEALDSQTKAKANIDFLEAKLDALKANINATSQTLSNYTASWPKFQSKLERKTRRIKRARARVVGDLQRCEETKGSGSRKRIMLDAATAIFWETLQNFLRKREKQLLATSKTVDIPTLLHAVVDDSRLKEQVEDHAPKPLSSKKAAILKKWLSLQGTTALPQSHQVEGDAWVPRGGLTRVHSESRGRRQSGELRS